MFVSKVVADVLAEHTLQDVGLQDVGLQDVRPKTSDQNLQEQLEVEKKTNGELRRLLTPNKNRLMCFHSRSMKLKK
jgi:hypothetical protein